MKLNFLTEKGLFLIGLGRKKSHFAGKVSILIPTPIKYLSVPEKQKDRNILHNRTM